MASIPDGAYNGTEVQFWFEGKMLYQQSSSGYYIGEDPYYGVTDSWLVKGPNGEPLEWYWDANFTQSISLGDDIYGHHYDEFGVTLFVAIYGKRMDIKLKMGAKASLPSSKNKGTVYFAKDGDKNFGELYYDDENGNRVKVGGTNISSAEFFNVDNDGSYSDIKLNLTFEDGTILTTNNIPYADFLRPGVMSNNVNDLSFIQYMPVGVKSFFPAIQIGTPNAVGLTEGHAIIIGDVGYLDEDASINTCGYILSPNGIMMGTEDGSVMFGLLNEVDGGTGAVCWVGEQSYRLSSGYFWTDFLGAETEYIPTAFIEELHSTSINAAQFEGAFAGDLEGTARDAISWTNAILLNGTEVKGGETGAITTAKWGAERNISISSAAGTTGTIIDGSNEDGYTLIIPATMTGFTSITSTNLLATNLGAASTPIGTSHFKETYFHNPNNNNYKHKLTSNAGSADCELQLPNTSGLIVTKASTTTAVGGLNAPVFVAASGEVTACSTVSVEHGGTGSNSLGAYSLLYGNGTNAVGEVTPMAAGRILVSGGTTSAPVYASPSLSFSTGASNPTISFVINGATYSSTNSIQSATGENPGLVSTTTQTFAGAKTFTGAVNFNAGITTTTGTFSGQINATNIKLSGQLKSHSAGTSYLTLTDTKATVTSPTVYLNGTTIVLNSSNYGPTLPTTNLEEGRIFFLLT